jgi:hypothetical protein
MKIETESSSLQLGERLMTRVPTMTLPERGCRANDKRVGDSKKAQGVQGPGAIAPCDHGLCL